MKRSTSRFLSLPVGLLLSASLVACGGGDGEENKGTVKGRVTDDGGAQARDLAGAGTLAAAASAKLAIVGDDGSLTIIGEAAVQADGSYSIDSATVGEQKLVVQIVNDADVVIGSVILDQGLTANATAIAAPVTSETSLEAEVFIALAGSADLTVDQIDTTDIKARIDAQTAITLDASASFEADLTAVANATASAQAAFFASLNTTAQAAFDASVQAAADLAVDLDAAVDGSADAEAAADAYLVALIDVYTAEGFDANEQADAQVTAAISFQLTVNAQASAQVATQAALQSQAYLGLTLATSTEVLLTAAGAAQASIDAAVAAGIALRSDLSAANNAAAGATAFVEYEDDVVSGNNSVLTVALGADLSGALALEQVVIDTAILAFDTAIQATATVDAQATAQAVVAAYATLDATVSASINTALVLSGQAKADAAASIFVSAEAGLIATAQ